MENLDAESIATLIKGGATALSVALGSKPAAMFIEKVSGMVGWAMEPTTIKRKARAEAAASIIKAEADQEIKAIEQRMASRIIYEEVKFQQNLETVVLKALININEGARPDKVDDDWFVDVFDKCRRISNESIQNLWAQVLAGEVNLPGSFSARTIHFLTTISQADAELIRKLRSYVWKGEDNEGYLILHDEMFGDESLLELFNPDFYHLNEIGIINILGHGALVYEFEKVVISYGGYDILLIKPDDKNIQLGAVKLTDVALEILDICEFIFDEKYFNESLMMLEKMNYKPTMISKK